MSGSAPRSGKTWSRYVAYLHTLLIFALFTFLFHFAWEILQAPLFARMPEISHWQATLVCLKATLGDVGIAFASFAVAALWSRRCNLVPASGCPHAGCLYSDGRAHHHRA